MTELNDVVHGQQPPLSQASAVSHLAAVSPTVDGYRDNSLSRQVMGHKYWNRAVNLVTTRTLDWRSTMWPTWTPLRWTLYVVAAIGAVWLLAWNFATVRWLLEFIAGPDEGIDFTATFTNVVSRTNPYEGGGYIWSPLVVPILALVVPLGLTVWHLLHIAALAFIRPWWVALLVGLSVPFWWDIASGNIGIFVFVVAWWAVSGSRVGTVAFLVMALLIPRPLMLPVLGWILWQQPWTRVPFVVVGLTHLGLVASMGLLDDWALTLAQVMPKEELKTVNYAPSRWLGYVPWALIFLPLSAWLTYKGRLGLASIAASPYLFPFYLLMGFLELRRFPESPEGGVCHRWPTSAGQYWSPRWRPRPRSDRPWYCR